MQKLSNSEKIDQLRKSEIVQLISTREGDLVYACTKLSTELSVIARNIAAQCIRNKNNFSLLANVPPKISSKVKRIVSGLANLKDPELAKVVRERVAQDILAGKESNPRKLATGTSIHNSPYLSDLACVLESDEPASLNNSDLIAKSIDIKLAECSLTDGEPDSTLDAIRKEGKTEN